ncbi:SRPBCC family protein [Tomitella biformata]|uniref:SRPBCC family protein n=1 Tax=Tomitella biformata TaxID=630403 RepID=UPI000463388E|nr:SRPBCC domain-containing protein [Tomitella biformata]
MTAEFTITRTFDAPREILWQAWTDPDEAPLWWHPRGVSTPRESVHFDFHVGGRYRYTMVNDATGEEYPTGGQYLEIDEPSRLSFTWGLPDDPVEDSPVVTVTLVALGDKTEMTFHLRGIGGTPGDGNVYDGWDSAFDLLLERLAH